MGNQASKITMATLTKKDLLEAIEDMPMDAKICIISPETDDAYMAEAVNVSMKFNQIEIC